MSTPLPKPRPPVKPAPKSPLMQSTKPKPESVKPAEPDHRVHKIADGLLPLATPIADLQLDPENVRLHSEFQIGELSAGLMTLGQLKPIVVDAETGIVVAGNATLAAAAKNGWTHIAAVKADPKKHDLKRFAIADNRIADLSEFDEEALAKVIADLPEDARLGLGWSQDEIDEMLDIGADSGIALSGDASGDVTAIADKQSKIAESTRVDFTAEQYAKIKSAIAKWVAAGNKFADDASAIVAMCCQ